MPQNAPFCTLYQKNSRAQINSRDSVTECIIKLGSATTTSKVEFGGPGAGAGAGAGGGGRRRHEQGVVVQGGEGWGTG